MITQTSFQVVASRLKYLPVFCFVQLVAPIQMAQYVAAMASVEPRTTLLRSKTSSRANATTGKFILYD